MEINFCARQPLPPGAAPQNGFRASLVQMFCVASPRLRGCRAQIYFPISALENKIDFRDKNSSSLRFSESFAHKRLDSACLQNLHGLLAELLARVDLAGFLHQHRAFFQIKRERLSGLNL